MKTNREKLPMMSVSGSVDHPGLHGDGYWVGYDGYGRIAMSVGGIVYNYSLLDPCMGIVGDHIEPGVSIKNSVDKYNTALQCFACIGNEARIVNGPAAGQKGYVSGKHGGVDHVMVWFPREVLEKMNADERILIRAWGQGMKLTDHPGVQLMNLDPDLLEAMDLQHGAEGKLQVPVVTRIPAFLMGAGIGSTTTMSGDYDIMTQDHEANQKYGIDRLRFGDLVLIEDAGIPDGFDQALIPDDLDLEVQVADTDKRRAEAGLIVRFLVFLVLFRLFAFLKHTIFIKFIYCLIINPWCIPIIKIRYRQST